MSIMRCGIIDTVEKMMSIDMRCSIADTVGSMMSIGK